MSSANALRQQIEATLSRRIPAALSPVPRTVRPVAPVGIDSVDALLHGGMPVGAITELAGPECSGRSSLALSYVAGMISVGKVCAWIDALDTLSPESAAANGVDLRRLLWVRCGVALQADLAPRPLNITTLPRRYFTAPPPLKGLHGAGGGPHPRTETKGLPEAISGFLGPDAATALATRGTRARLSSQDVSPAAGKSFNPGRAEEKANTMPILSQPFRVPSRQRASSSHAARVDQALRATDLILQGGGFGAIVVDLGGVAPEIASRVPLATWFRYRAAAEKSQTSIVLLTRMACAKSSAGLVLQLHPGQPLDAEPTLLSGISYRLDSVRERFQPPTSNVVPMRKPPQRATSAAWQSQAGLR